MRVPRYETRRFRVRGWLIVLALLVVVLLFSMRGLAGFYTDYLWFDTLGQGGTWGRLLAARAMPALVFTIAFFGIVLVNLLIADRLAPRYAPLGTPTPEDEMVSRYQEATARFRGRIRVGVSIFFALIAGLGVSAQWREWILFTHRVDFGVRDPQFDRDVGFYVFTLPFLKFIVDWLFAGLVIVLLITAVAHYLNGGIRFQTSLQRVTPQVKAHLSVILAVMALVKAAQYWLSQYELTTSDRGFVDGAGYTDVKAQLPALQLLLVISIVAAGLFLWNIRRRGWVLPVIAVGLWAFISLAIGTIYPAIIQGVKVNPNELAQEQPYIARNIVATRAAFGLSGVDSQPYDFQEITDPAVVDAARPTLANARLWDPDVIESTYQRLQGLQTFYKVTDVDVDRYTIGSDNQQVLIAARDLNPSELPSQSWVNEHVVYTHGYGSIVSPSNEAEANSGDPVYFLSDIPPQGNGIDLEGQGAEIYFGEDLPGYVIVDAKQDEFNYARAGRSDARNRYDGQDGIKLSNIFRKAAFALRFGDVNPLISSALTSDSRVIMIRDVRERVEKIAPFLSFDDDPYPAVIDNRIVWILDGYTTSDRYPYAQFAEESSGGLPGSVNYARNSVKITVDAYDGTVRFYVFHGNKDPLIRAYQKAFPDLFTSGSAMSADLEAHLRYPQDLFRMQSDVYGKYHVTEPRRFYQGNERWLRSPSPSIISSIAGVSGTGASSRGAQRSAEITATTPRQEPYYLNIQLPGDDSTSFVLLQPYVPVSKDNQLTRLASFLTVKSDPGKYGSLESFVMPIGSDVRGPVQVANAIESDPVLSSQFTLLRGGGSTVIKGNIQLIPVGGSLVYVEPIYVQQAGGQGYPQFRFVVVFNQGALAPAQGQTVNEALDRLFNISSPTPPTTPTTPSTPTTPTTPTTSVPGGQSVNQLLAQAQRKLQDADAARLAGNLGQYQQLVSDARALIDQAARLAGGG